MRTLSRALAATIATALVASAIGLSGCAPDKDTAALVNGQPVKLSAITAQLNAMKTSSPQLFAGADGKARESEFRFKILESIIQYTLIEQGAKEFGITITDAQVNDYVKQLEAQYGGAAGLESAMKSSSISRDQLVENVRNRLLVEAVGAKITKAGAITDAQIKAYYDANKSMFEEAASVRASHILFKTDDKATAEKVLKELQGGADFAAAAKKYSIDGSKDKGGDLGYQPSSTYVPGFKEAVDTMKVGELRLVQSQFGWHIILLVDRRPARERPLAEVSEQIRQIIQQQQQTEAFTKYVDGLKKKAKIEVIDPELKKAWDAAQVVKPAATPSK